MRGPIFWTLAASLLACGSPLLAQSRSSILEQIANQPPVLDDPLIFADAGRLMNVLVTVDGQGPYTFLVDTGAQRTVISHDLARLLDLKPGRKVNVIAITNEAMIDTVVVPSLRVNEIVARQIEAPTLDQVNLGAPGILGLDALRGHAVSIDFSRNEMSVSPAARRHTVTFYGLSFDTTRDPRMFVVAAKDSSGQLIMTNARYHGKRVSVLIDTGTPVTIANSAFLRISGKSPKPIGSVIVTSALGRDLPANLVLIDRLEIGDIGLNNIPLAVADAEPFKRLGLADTPALLLGMDALRLFRQVDIDFANQEIRFRVPTSTQVVSR
jgi:predicted aspartyl protease